MARTIFVGDIHGCYAELMDLLAKVGLNDDDRLISVGDVVDRGPASGQVVEFFRGRPGSVVLCGNHERKHVRGVLTYAQEIVALQLGGGYSEVVSWMGSLPYYYEDSEIIAVHAALVPGVGVSETPVEVLCGTTSGEERLGKMLGGKYWTELYVGEKPVVFGHHVVGSEPKVFGDRVFGIDTGACHGQTLSALVLPAFQLISVPARRDYWREEQIKWQVPVLAARPWAKMTFEQLHKKTEELKERHPVGRAYLGRVQEWGLRVRAFIPTLALIVDGLAGELLAQWGEEFPARVADHPAGNTLIRWVRGRIQAETLGCVSPEAVFVLAAALGVGISEDLRVPVV